MINLKVDPYNECRSDSADLDVSVKCKFAEQNAFIVKAVNNHDALVAIVERLIRGDGTDGYSRAAKLDARELLNTMK